MRSRSNSLENIAEGKSSQVRAHSCQQRLEHKETLSSIQGPNQPHQRESLGNKGKIQHNCTSSSSRQNGYRERTMESRKSRDLSRDDLIFLLSMLEGELQVGKKMISEENRTKIPDTHFIPEFHYIKDL